MKAAVIYQRGELLRYADTPEPVAQQADQLVLTVKAAAIKHFDKSRASRDAPQSDGPGHIIGGTARPCGTGSVALPCWSSA